MSPITYKFRNKFVIGRIVHLNCNVLSFNLVLRLFLYTENHAALRVVPKSL